MNTDTNQLLYNELFHSGKILATNIKPLYSNNVYKEYTANPFFDQSSRAFNIHYLQSPEFIEQIKKNPLYTGFVPPEFFNENDIWELINANPLSIINFDESYIQPNMYATAVMCEPRLIGLLSDQFQTVEIVREVIKKEPMALRHVRDDLKYYYICNDAVARDWRSIEFVPSNIIDSKLIDEVFKNEGVFILDKIDRDKLEIDTYLDQLIRFPIEGATHLIAANMINSEKHINELIYFIENLDSYAPQYIFNNCDPKILMHYEKYNALLMLLEKRPTWIEHLKSCFITKEIFEIAIKHDIYPQLEGINWSYEIISSAFTLNKKAYIHLPYSRIKAVGVDRITQTIEEAMENGWVDQLPKYFFIDEVVSNLELRQRLLSSRAPLSYILTQAHQLDWERVLHLDCSIAEYRLLNQTIPPEMAATFFDKHIESYVALSDTDKTMERTEIFLATYPSELRCLPKNMQENSSVMRQLIEKQPIIGRYLETEEIINSFKPN